MEETADGAAVSVPHYHPVASANGNVAFDPLPFRGNEQV
jgi:hypothetical protein